MLDLLGTGDSTVTVQALALELVNDQTNIQVQSVVNALKERQAALREWRAALERKER